MTSVRLTTNSTLDQGMTTRTTRSGDENEEMCSGDHPISLRSRRDRSAGAVVARSWKSTGSRVCASWRSAGSTIQARSAPAASSPISSSGTRTVVSGGVTAAEREVVIAGDRDVRRAAQAVLARALWAPIASRSFAATIAVNLTPLRAGVGGRCPASSVNAAHGITEPAVGGRAGASRTGRPRAFAAGGGVVGAGEMQDRAVPDALEVFDAQPDAVAVVGADVRKLARASRRFTSTVGIASRPVRRPPDPTSARWR